MASRQSETGLVDMEGYTLVIRIKMVSCGGTFSRATRRLDW